jgi:hypothetical protein
MKGAWGRLRFKKSAPGCGGCCFLFVIVSLLRLSKEELLFVNKKKQKNFAFFGAVVGYWRCLTARIKRAKVFWFFFSKKNRLL